MAYEQIDGNKNILVNEKGQLREELRNIDPDYEYDDDGNVDKEKWPTVVVQSDTEGTDRRLLPAEVLKIHGDLPINGHYTPNMFDAEDGDKTNCSKENIIYNADAPKKPYKSDPSKESEDEEPKTSGKVVHDPTKEAQKNADDSGDAEEPEEEKEGNSSGNNIVGQSGDFNATEAIEIINNNSFADLEEADFFNEDELNNPRTTVVEAWEKKEKQAAE
jgi:hypothetical protein